MFYSILRSIRTNSSNKIYTDGIVSRLHYKTTFIALIFFSFIATSSNNLGKPIECTSGQKNVPSDFIKTYCWIHPTFIVENNKSNQITSTQEIIPFYGLENSNEKDKKRIYNGFYQWVSLAFLLQAALIYMPRLLWKNTERKIIKTLLLDEDLSFFKKDSRANAVEHIAANIKNKTRICSSSNYYHLIFTEFLNLTNLLVQIIFINNFLNESLFQYALKVLNHSNWSFETFFDPMTKTFPKMAKCKYYDYGASGSPNVIDHLCVLPYNIYFEKIYLFLFFWFGILLAINIINLIFRVLLSFSRELRTAITSKQLNYVNKKKLNAIIKSLSIGEWYILDVLSVNLDSDLFNEILNCLINETEECLTECLSDYPTIERKSKMEEAKLQ